MKKNKVLKCVFATILACGGIIATATSLCVAPVGADIEVSTADLLSRNSENERVSIRRAATTGQLDVSKIYTQVGSDAEGASYLRFAAAVKGDIDSLVYSASIEGSDYKIADKVITSVYKSIVANGEKTYFTGNSLIDAELLSTKDYYWACFTIKYGIDSQFKDNNINVTLTVNEGEQVLNRTESLNNKLNPSTGVTEYSLGDYITDCDAKGEKPAFTYTRKLTGHYEDDNGTKNDIPQGACSDGEYLYFAMNTNESTASLKNAAGFVVKYNPTTNTVEGRTSRMGEYADNNKGPGNANLFYNPIDGMIYLLGGIRAGGTGGACTDWKINPETMEVTELGEILEVDGFKFETPDINTYFSKWASTTVTFDVENLEYNPTLKKWAVIYRIKSNGTDIADGSTKVFRQLFFYDSDMKLSSTSNQGLVVNYTTSSDTSYGIQEMTSDSKYVYLDFTKWGDKNNSYVRIFDWNGDEIKLLKLSNSFADNSQANVQFVQSVGNELYIGAYESKTGITLTKATYPIPSTTSTPSETPEISLTLGEKAEYANLTSGSLSYSSNQVLRNKIVSGLLPTWNGTDGTDVSLTTTTKYWVSKGATSDGEYIYQILNAESGSKDGADIGILAKFTLDGELVGTTDYSFHWGNGPRVSYFDGKIIVSRTEAATKDAYGNVLTFTGRNLEFSTDLKTFNDNYVPVGDIPSGGELDMVADSQDGKKLVLVYKFVVNGTKSRKMYIYEKSENGELVKTVDGLDVSSSNSGVIAGVYGNIHYLYVLFNVAKNPIIRVMDYNGNTILEKNMSSIYEGQHTNKSSAGLFELNGSVYYTVFNYNWDSSKGPLNSPGGWELYRVDA